MSYGSLAELSKGFELASVKVLVTASYSNPVEVVSMGSCLLDSYWAGSQLSPCQAIPDEGRIPGWIIELSLSTMTLDQ